MWHDLTAQLKDIQKEEQDLSLTRSKKIWAETEKS